MCSSVYHNVCWINQLVYCLEKQRSKNYHHVWKAAKGSNNDRKCQSLSHVRLFVTLLWPTSLLCPWNSPSKNTEMGCQSLLWGVFPTPGSNPGLLHCRQIAVVHKAPLPMESPNKNTETVCHSLLQWIFATKGSNPGLLHCRQILYHLSHQGSVMIKECIFGLIISH